MNNQLKLFIFSIIVLLAIFFIRPIFSIDQGLLAKFSNSVILINITVGN